MDETGPPPQPIDPKLSQKVKDLTQSGVKTVAEMKLHIKNFVNEICPTNNQQNQRFCPTDQTIGQHMYNARNPGTVKDQEGVKELEDKSFIFFYQSNYQRKLLHRYGDVCLLDATYRTTAYDIPLFFVVVKTNCDYQIVATFMVENETRQSIIEPLKLLKEKNPNWKPKYFMTDFCEAEISALETVFEDSRVLLCNFHREQAWDRWSKKKENGLQNRQEVLQYLRQLAYATSEDQFLERLTALQESTEWANAKLRHYVLKVWLPVKEKWCYAYRKQMAVNITTTNGVETIHRILKSSFLRHKTSHSLASLLRILLHEFYPDRIQKYVDHNRKMEGTYRPYSTTIPVFLHNRPREFVKHVMTRIESAKEIDRQRLQFYATNLGSDQSGPSCECPDWGKTKMPCKHMIAAMLDKDDNVEWDKMSALYRSSPFYICHDIEADDKIMNTECQSTPMDHGTEMPQVPNIKKMQLECRLSLENIKQSTYTIKSVKCLEDLKERLDLVVHFLNTRVKDIQPTPLKKRKPSKAFHKRSGAKAGLLKENFKKKVVIVYGIISGQLAPHLLNAEQGTGVYKVEGVDQPRSSSIPAPMGKLEEGQDSLVDKIWNLSQDYNVLVAKVEDTKLSDSDIRSLSGSNWITDNVIDTYLQLLAKEAGEGGKRVLPLVTTTMSGILQGTFFCQKKEWNKLSSFDLIMGGYLRNAHWTLFAADVGERTVHFLNSLSERREEIEQILNTWSHFVDQYVKTTEDKAMPIQWSYRPIVHTRQKDGHNCGVFCMMFAERFLHKIPMDNITGRELLNMRRNVAKKLMCYADYLAECCTKCGDEVSEDEQKIWCNKCGRFTHFKPFCLEDDVCLMEPGGTFQRRLCRIRFWPQIFQNYSAEQSLCTRKKPTVKPKQAADLADRNQSTETVKDEELLVTKMDDKLDDQDVRMGDKPTHLHGAFVPKRKASTPIQSEATTKKQRHCSSNQQEKGKQWHCKVCQILIHPDCTNLDQEDSLDPCYCSNTCLDNFAQKMPVYSLQHLNPEEEAMDDIFNVEYEDYYLIHTDEVMALMPEAYKVCLKLTSSILISSKEDWMQRHFNFAKQPYYRQQKGFAFSVLSPRALMTVEMNIKAAFLEKMSITSNYSSVKHIANKTLHEAMQNSGWLAQSYVANVLVKEACVCIMQKLTKCTYSEATLEMETTEGLSNSELKVALKSIPQVKEKFNKM